MQPDNPQYDGDIEWVYGKKKKRGHPDEFSAPQSPRRMWCLAILFGLGCIGTLLLGFAAGFWLADENEFPEKTRIAGLTQTAAYTPVVTLGTPIFNTATPDATLTPTPTRASIGTSRPTNTATRLPAIQTAEINITIAVPQDLAQIPSIRWSNNGRLMAVAGSQGIRLFDANALGAESVTLPVIESEVFDIAFSPDSELVAAGVGDGSIIIWDIATRNVRYRLTGHSFPVWTIAFSPDGTRLVSGGDDGTIRFWDVTTGASLNISEPGGGAIQSVAYHPDGSQLAVGKSDGTIDLWNPDTFQFIKSLSGHSGRVWTVAFDPSDSILISGGEDDRIILWDLETDTPIGTLTAHRADVRSLALNNDGTQLASASDDGSVRIWDMSTRTQLHQFSMSFPALSVSFSTDGNRLGSGWHDGAVRIIDVETGLSRQTLPGR